MYGSLSTVVATGRSLYPRVVVRCSLLVGAGLVVAGCIALDDDPGRLTVVSTVPGPGGRHPAGAPLSVRFDRYLDPEVDWTPAVALRSGALDIAADVAYDPAGPDLVVTPQLALRPGVGYRLALDADGLQALGGAALEDDLELAFVAVSGPGRAPVAPVDFETEVRPLLERRCDCHGLEPRAYPPLEPDALVTLPSKLFPQLALVEAGSPLRSFLVLKILPDYPGLPGTSMPPGSPLTPDERRLLVAWVRSLR